MFSQRALLNQKLYLFQLRSARMAVGLLPAALITCGLFLGMRALISTEDFVLPAPTVHILEPYYTKPIIDEPERVTPQFEIPDIVLPPELPPIESMKTEGKFNVVPIHVPPTAAAPVEAQGINMAMPIVLDARELEPLSSPIVTYPPRAVRLGLEGSCEVRMDVTPLGRPFNVVAICTDRVFIQEAERAVSKVEFIPKLEGGRRVTRNNVIYPLQFQLPD